MVKKSSDKRWCIFNTIQRANMKKAKSYWFFFKWKNEEFLSYRWRRIEVSPPNNIKTFFQKKNLFWAGGVHRGISNAFVYVGKHKIILLRNPASRKRRELYIPCLHELKVRETYLELSNVKTREGNRLDIPLSVHASMLALWQGKSRDRERWIELGRTD